MSRLVVCGDSFMTPVTTHPKTHFSEIIADKLGYELVAYSRGGMSNGGIAIQIDTAIKNKADFILLGTSVHDRIEFSSGTTNRKYFDFTVEDIQYNHQNSISSHYPWVNKDPQLISTNLVEILDSNDNSYANFDLCSEPVKKKKAINYWFKYLYHEGWKAQTDRWILYAILHKLHLSKIPYLFCFDYISVAKTCPWLTDSVNNVVHNFHSILLTEPDPWTPTFHETNYHTTVKKQQQFADYALNHIDNTRILHV